MPRVTDRGEALAFIARAVASATDDCIVWPYAQTSAGYGLITYIKPNGRRSTTTAHRIVLERTAGPAPSRQHHAAHAPKACHLPSCVNPRHLRWASPAENSADQIADGTRRFGWLAPADVRTIRVSADKPSVLARKYGVSASAISMARTGKTHRHVA